MWNIKYDERRTDGSGNSEYFGREEFQDNTTRNNEHLRTGNKNTSKQIIIECRGQNYSNIEFNGLEYDTYEWAEYVKKNGYEGVIFNNIIDGAGYEYF